MNSAAPTVPGAPAPAAAPAAAPVPAPAAGPPLPPPAHLGAANLVDVPLDADDDDAGSLIVDDRLYQRILLSRGIWRSESRILMSWP
jgi:hypothetical protein